MRVYLAGTAEPLVGRVSDALLWDLATVDESGVSVLVQDETRPIRGALSVDLADGTTQRVPASEVNEIIGEMQVGMPFTRFLAYVSQSEGMFATDSVTGEMVSNGMRWVNHLELDERPGGERPAWAPDDELLGIQGPMLLEPGDKVVWGRMLFGGDAETSYNHAAAAGWYQVRDGRVVNEGFLAGEPDFAWGAQGPLNWLAPSSFNSYMEPELRVALLVNGVTNMNAELARRLNLPADWERYRTPQDEGRVQPLYARVVRG